MKVNPATIMPRLAAKKRHEKLSSVVTMENSSFSAFGASHVHGLKGQIMTTNREYTTVLNLFQDDDGDSTYTYVFGHDCKPEALIDVIKGAIATWLRTDDAKQYVTDNWPCVLDWVDCLGNIPPSFLDAVGITRLDLTWGVDVLPADDDLIPEDMAEFYENLNLYGPDDEAEEGAPA